MCGGLAPPRGPLLLRLEGAPPPWIRRRRARPPRETAGEGESEGAGEGRAAPGAWLLDPSRERRGGRRLIPHLAPAACIALLHPCCHPPGASRPFGTSPSPGTCLLANADDFDAVLLSAPAVAVAEEQQEAAREVERGLLELQQVFLDKALVEAQGAPRLPRLTWARWRLSCGRPGGCMMRRGGGGFAWPADSRRFCSSP